MSGSGHRSSPDPLTLPSSPLATRFTRSPSNALSQRSVNIHATPSKSFIMETGKAGDASPWRIKVTVEAEPTINDGSPSKKRVTRSTSTVPVKGSASRSPAKRPARRATPVVTSATGAISSNESEETAQRQPRKRKATPIRRTRKTQPAPLPSEPARINAQDDNDAAAPIIAPSSSPTQHRSSSARSRKVSLQPLPPTQRYKRLSQAREELDQALHDAVGYSDADDDDDGEGDDFGHLNDHVPGDMTVAGEEEFTMVSVDTLQSLKADTSRISGVGDRSGLSVSYFPSSPPKSGSKKGQEQPKGEVTYPDLQDEAEQARETTYDAMSWKPTGAPKILDNEQIDSEPSSWRRHREAVSREIENANTSQVIVIEDTTVDKVTGEEANDGDNNDDDIWQEEASRSLQEDDQPQSHHSNPAASRPPQLDDLFVDQPLKPRRSKIPRTWRRTSGNDFSYVDSPENGALQRKISDAGSRSSGVLTPPSTDDEAGKALHDHPRDEVDLSLTQPDAAATLLQDQEDNQSDAAGSHVDSNDVSSPLSNSSSESVASPDGEDTGLFWQSNLPNIYRRPRPRPQRQRAMDLSELLNLNKSSSPAKPVSNQTSGLSATSVNRQMSTSKEAQHIKFSPLRMRPVKGSVKSSPTDVSRGMSVSSPLRKSLYRSSKMLGSPLQKSRLPQPTALVHHETEGLDEAVTEAFVDSFESKASDQRQLLGEMSKDSTNQRHSNRSTVPAHNEPSYAGINKGPEHNQYETDEEAEDEEDCEEDIFEPSRSYEEHLNVESPQKIKVNFNDSAGNSSLLAPVREYRPLFSDKPIPSTATSPPAVTIVAKRQSAAPIFSTLESVAQSNVLSRLTTTFWTAVTRPAGAPLAQPTSTPVDYIHPTLQAQIRSRYGVLPSTHPWTMTHMRTIHRMVNSCTSNKSDSIIPKPTATTQLPTYLANLIDKPNACKSPSGHSFTMTPQLALVVESLTAVLVPAHVVAAMEKGEIEFLGDGTAWEYRGLMGGKYGQEGVWETKGVKLPANGDRITGEFVASAIGDVVRANDDLARRQREASEGMAS